MTNDPRILIADDDPTIVDALTMMLEDEGYAVEGTYGRETLDKAHSWLPQLLLLDMWMPGMNGREICKRLKQREPTQSIAIIMLSASKDAEAIATAAGADGFLAKPFEMDEVLRLAEKYTERQ